MERSHSLLLAAGLLAALLTAAAATIGPQCDPKLLATQAALFCAPDMSTAQCCEPVVAAFDLGGSVPCMCRVTAEPQLVMAGLNASHLLTIYTSCGGLRPGVAHLAAACEDQHPHVSSKWHHRTGLPSKTDVCPSATGLSDLVGILCGQVPMRDDCCSVLETAASSSDTLACLCLLSEDLGVSEGGLTISDVIKTYAHCTGIHHHLPAAGCSHVLANNTSPRDALARTPPTHRLPSFLRH